MDERRRGGARRAILADRADRAFVEGACDDSAIARAAAIAAKDRGNARQAIDLLRVGGEVARRSDADRVDDSHIVKAQELVQRGRLRNRIEDQTQHAQLLLETVAYIEQAREVSGTVESDQGSIRIGRRIACRGSTDDSQKHPEPSLRSPHARVSAAMGSKSR